MARIRSRPLSVRGSRRQTDWGISIQTNAEVNIAASTSALVASAAAATLAPFAPFTIVRTRGVLWFGSDQEAADEIQIGAMGLAIVSEAARAAGAASIPGPMTDATFDGWFAHQYFANKFSFVTAAGFDSVSGRMIEFDSKGMRKVTTDDALVFVIENFGATQGINVTFGLRILLKAG